MIDIDSDLSQCTDFDVPADFATTPTTTVNGVFTGGTDETLMYGQIAVEKSNPSFTVRTSLVGFVVTKMNVTINAVSYKVEKKEDLGTGLTVIWLRTN
jgi:Phage Head-Tail Attachment.